MTVDHTSTALFLDPCDMQTIELVADPRDPETRWRLFRGAVLLRGATRAKACRHIGASYNHGRI